MTTVYAGTDIVYLACIASAFCLPYLLESL